jgi:tRNA nucleotidyltransferase/poly(A) polymerase
VIRLGGEEHLSAYRVVDPTGTYDFAELLDHSIDADLARRDFRVNAMALDLRDGTLLDPFDGRGDLARRVVRMVDPRNFDDDPLRMLKAIRMAVRLGFTIDAATVAAIRPRASAITSVAAERVMYELTIILSSSTFRRSVALLRDTALDVPLFGRELGPVHADDVPLAAALALLVRDPRAFCERWKSSAALLRQIETLQRLARERTLLELYEAGEEIARQLAPMLRASGADEAIALPDFSIVPLLMGEEIAKIAGIAPGPRVGEIKRAMLAAQLEGRIVTRDAAESFVRGFA